MALSILDGNQTATTLSTILSSGQHITAHTVVSLGTQAITDIVNATSAGLTNAQLRASAVTIAGTVTVNSSANFDVRVTQGGDPVDSNNAFPVYGTVTANNVIFNDVSGFQSAVQAISDIELNAIRSAIWIADSSGSNGSATEGQILSQNYPMPISGTVTANLGSALPAGANRIGVVTIGAGTVTLGASTSQIGSVTASISGTVPVSGAFFQATQPVSLTTLPALVAGTAQIGSVTVGNSVTIGSLPAISGTVTANGGDGTFLVGGLRSGGKTALQLDAGTGYLQTKVESLPSLVAGTAQIGSVTASISGTVPISISSVTVGNSVAISSLPAISGTVTANSSNGSLTTQFGSVVTANTAFATSAVTNTNRKYLLIQNITTASNVITVGIGFTPTTTQGIQLFAGAGLTFEGSYIPTGAVNLLSSVTASCYTILEA